MSTFPNFSRLVAPARYLTTAVLLAAAVLFPEPATGRGRPEGEEVIVAGAVTDPAGRPIPGVTLELRGSRLAFSMRDFRLARRGRRTATATTDAKGNFELRWTWHPYYNRFELAAGVDLSGPATPPRLEVLTSTDLSRRIRAGNPVVVTLEITDRSIVDELNAFLATVDTQDERKVYQQMGKPDKVRDTTYPDSRQTTWWYFERGRVYRFEDGAMRGVEDFEPIDEIQN